MFDFVTEYATDVCNSASKLYEEVCEDFQQWDFQETLLNSVCFCIGAPVFIIAVSIAIIIWLLANAMKLIDMGCEYFTDDGMTLEGEVINVIHTQGCLA